jgi:hypothetical protein
MIDHSVDLLLKRSELRIRISSNLSNSVTRCLERSMKAIVTSRQLLANSEALLSYPESCDPDALTLAPATIEGPALALQLMVSKRDFEGEVVSTDAKHFRDCGFRNCTLLYGGAPVTFESCRFHDCRFSFSGAAGRTVQFLDCFGIMSQQADDQACDSAAPAAYFLN